MSHTRVAAHLLGSVALVSLLPAAAIAQEASAPPPPADTTAPVPAGQNDAATQTQAATTSDTEVIVTARRRSERLQNVPIAVSAFSGEQLSRRGAIDIADIAQTTPNVTFQTSRGTNSTLTAFIRGVGQQDPVAGFEGGVGLYLDDVYLNRPQGALLDIYDVERVEVLRGPQGTLYGRNTIGGAIKYVTRRLPNRPAMEIRANLGTYKQADLIVSGSAPVTDTLRIGAAAARLSRGGFGRNLTTGQENYNKDIIATRGTVEFEPSAGAFFRVTGDYTWDDSNTRGGHRLIPSLLTRTPVLSDVFDSQGALVLPKQKVKGGGISLTGELPLGEGLKLRSITAFRKDKSTTPIDFDALPSIDVDVPAIYRNRQFSQEAQILVDRGPLSGLVGAYYLNARARNVFDVILGTTGALIGVPNFDASTFGDVKTKTWAVFGDFSYKFTDQFSLSLGGRFTNDKRQAVVIRQNVANGPIPALGGNGVVLATTSNFTGEKTFKQFTPRASLSYMPNPDNTLYLSWSKGFKGGGFDPRGVSTQAPDLNGNGVREPSEIFDYFLFDPEKVTSYEAGYKASLFDRRLTIAADVFHARYKNVQVPGSVGAVINGVPTFVGVTTNAGRARFNGAELEASAVLARGFAGAGSRVSLAGSVGYIDAKYLEYISNVAGYTATGQPSPTTPNGPVNVAPFRKIQNTPKWTNSASLDFALPTSGGVLSGNTSVSYRSKTYRFEIPSPYLDQKAFALFDANLQYAFGKFTVGLHGRNLFNKKYQTGGYQFLTINPVTGEPVLSVAPTNVNFNKPGIAPSLGREGVVTAFYGSPRQIFASFDVKF